MIVAATMSILITGCNSSQFSDPDKTSRTFQQVITAKQMLEGQHSRINQPIAQQQLPIPCLGEIMREPSNGNWKHMDIRIPTDKCPGERGIRHLVIDQNNPDTVYAAGRGLFKSTDAGGTWTAINQWMSVDPSQMIGRKQYKDTQEIEPIEVLAINPRNSSEIYLATRYLFKSSDGGNTWVLPKEGFGGKVSVLIFDSEIPNMVYAGTDSGFFKSWDGGKRWIHLLDNQSITTMVVDPQDSNVMYAGTSHGALLKTSNRGKTWDRLQPGLPGISIQSLTIDARDHNTVYVGTLAAEVYKTMNGGGQWSGTRHPQFGIIHTLVSDPLYADTIYAVTLNGVFKTEDGGSSWHADNTGLGTTVSNQSQVFALAIDPRPSKSMYAATVLGVVKRTHRGKE